MSSTRSRASVPISAVRTAGTDSAHLSHFAINADDVDRAKRFYERVFGWRFSSWGPPDFFKISTGGVMGGPQPVHGALQKRRELIPGERMTTYECSISVTDVDAVATAVVANGGTIVLPRTLIPTVGHLIFFRDPEGNVAGAIQYAPGAEDEM